jgi:hypothetical protein
MCVAVATHMHRSVHGHARPALIQIPNVDAQHRDDATRALAFGHQRRSVRKVGRERLPRQCGAREPIDLSKREPLILHALTRKRRRIARSARGLPLDSLF